MRIPGTHFAIGKGKPVFIVAEIGKGFIQTQENQPPKAYLSNARALIERAKEAGADAAKFQTHTVEDEFVNVEVVSPHFTGSDRYRWIQRNTFPVDFWEEIKSYCEQVGILFFSTPMSRGAAAILETIGVNLWKVGSGDILDFVMLDYIAATKKPVILSSGMSTLEELDRAVDFLMQRDVDLALMHCVSRYPCPPEKLNLQTIPFLENRYKSIPVGFSDHSLGTTSSLAAVALGATMIEKHFSTSRELWGSDHKVSLTPEELAQLVKEIRVLENDEKRAEEYLRTKEVQRSLGTAQKCMDEAEAVFRPIFRKTLVASQSIPSGTQLQQKHLYAMRPQAYLAGLPSERYEEILGKVTTTHLQKYEPITWSKLTSDHQL